MLGCCVKLCLCTYRDVLRRSYIIYHNRLLWIIFESVHSVRGSTYWSINDYPRWWHLELHLGTWQARNNKLWYRKWKYKERLEKEHQKFHSCGFSRAIKLGGAVSWDVLTLCFKYALLISFHLSCGNVLWRSSVIIHYCFCTL